MPGVLPERGNPIHTPALFLVQDVGTRPQGVLSPQPLHCTGQGRSPAAPGSSIGAVPAPCSVLFSSKASSHEIYWFLNAFRARQALKPCLQH